MLIIAVSAASIAGVLLLGAAAFFLFRFLAARHDRRARSEDARTNGSFASPVPAHDAENPAPFSAVRLEMSRCGSEPDEDGSGNLMDCDARSLFSCNTFVQQEKDSTRQYWVEDEVDEQGGFLAFPTCAGTAMTEFGRGIKSCQSCGARPMRNRGCGQCDKVMCTTCFEAHKELRTSTLLLAKAAIRKYDRSTGQRRGSLVYAEWSELLRDLGVPQQTEDEFTASCLARGADPRATGITFEHLVVLVTFLSSNASEALARLVPPADVAPARLCQFETHLHDWGPGLASCAVCASCPILNRGCRICSKRMCQRCFAEHAAAGALDSLSAAHPAAQAHAPPPGATVSPDCLASPAPPTPQETGAEAAAAPPAAEKPCDVLPPSLGANLPTSSDPLVCASFHGMFGDAGTVEKLGKGGALYFFTFLKGTSLTKELLTATKAVINLSGFADETRDNCVPHIDPLCPKAMAEYVFMLNKAVYMLPSSVPLDAVTKDLMVLKDYQKRCQPGGVKVYDVTEKDTFRFCKTIIWPVYKLTMQFKVTELPPALYAELAPLQDNLPVHKALLLERTKRNKNSSDIIQKAKSILLYHRLEGGAIVVTNITAGAATSVPAIIASIVDKVCVYLFVC